MCFQYFLRLTAAAKTQYFEQIQKKKCRYPQDLDGKD
jgi:hypothetical protein